MRSAWLLISIATIAARADDGGADAATGAAPDTAPLDRDAMLARGIELLLARQTSLDGGEANEWPYDGAYRVRGPRGPETPIGYRAGSTAICAWALIEAPGWDEAPERRAAVGRAARFLVGSLEHPGMSAEGSAAYDVRGWGQIYALAFLVRARELGRLGELRESAEKGAIPELIRRLEKTAFPGVGGWHYSRQESPSTFMTAPALQALFAAQAAGFAVDSETVDLAVRSIVDARLETGAFQYASFPARKTGRAIEAVPGSIGRSPICEVTLHLAGKGSVERIGAAVDDFFLYWRWLDERRAKTGTHRPPYMIAPYYFCYAHFYAAQAIELLPDAKRPEYRARLSELLERTRQANGGWNDRVFERSESYSTAIALLALLSPDLPRPTAWTSAPDPAPAPDPLEAPPEDRPPR